MDEVQRTLSRVTSRLLVESKASATATNENLKEKGRDLLSVLVQSNMATDLPDHQRLSDDQVKARKVAFARHLYDLSQLFSQRLLHF
jgi:hypothetical protein